ncbi:hypothetical protein [Myroides odoratus]|uniref:Uncharacterized protein n=1 Tax=Myroides odoratus TaxID=256 RepID=A0A378U4Q1_MYROD|nr:hypothetical protein [Myroides odoratus]QQU02779.1 hypothetical protein I6I89_13265 [Myroides odoratus]STZ69991.1 Uncharacterised protein [Myroides odoratus]
MELLINNRIKKVTQLVFLFLFLPFGYGQIGVKVEILNSEVIDGDLLEIRISNQTDQSIFLPWDVSILSYEVFTVDFERTSVFVLKIVLRNLNTEEQIPFVGEGTSMQGGNFNKFDTWKKIVANKKGEDFILLKKGEEKEISIPFKLLWSEDADNFYKYKVSEPVYNLSLSYQLNTEWMNKFIDKRVLKQLSKKGYVPYFEEIHSNQVLVHINEESFVCLFN